ncbi:MAG: LAGLIDADG family homing endonuclease [Candidatus Woesearchaeota archaeon]
MNDIIIGRSESDKKKLGDKATVLLGKHYIRMGRTSSLSNKVFIDVAGSHVVFICGKRGGGKCVTGDTQIVLGDGSLKNISKLNNDDHNILSLNKDLKMSFQEKESFFEREVDSILKLTLSTGKQISCTPEHPLLTFFGWEEAGDLNVGTKIATPLTLPVFGEFDVEELKVKQTAYNISGKSYFVDTFLNAEQSSLEKSGVVYKKIPEFIFKLTKYKLALFLNRLFSANATLQKKDFWSVVFKHKSPVVLTQIQHLLLRFGVVSFIQKNELLIREDFVRSFIQNIGFFGDKEKKQKIALREVPLRSFDEYLDSDFWEFFDPEDWEKLGENFNSSTSSFTPNNLASKHKNFVNYLMESDIYWDEIVKVEKIDEKTKVYDITVPETNNFVANDIIIHNSYTMGVFAEGVADLPEEIKQNISVILLDTMGVYWTMKYANKQDRGLLDDWGLEGKGLDVKIFTPKMYHEEYKDKDIPTDFSFAINPSELSGKDWNTTFDVDPHSEVGVLIEKTIYELTESGKRFDVDDIVKALENDKDSQKHVINAAKNMFINSKSWGLFDKDATTIADLAIPGQVSVLDVSCYATMPGSWNVKNLVVGLVADKLFVERMKARKGEEYDEVHKALNPYSSDDKKKQDFPLVWLVIDEAHEFMPVEGKTLATDPLVTILREGRQPGISLVLATQQPGKIHTDVMTQSDTVIAHRITAKLDTDALSTLMQSYMRKGLVEELDNLPREKGSAIIFDDTNEKMYPIRIRPRFTWHGGGSPTAVKQKKE